MTGKILDNARMLESQRISNGPAYARVNLDRDKWEADEAAKKLAPPVATQTGVPILKPDGKRTGFVVSFEGMGDDVPAATRTAVLNKAALAPALYQAAGNVFKTFKDLNGEFAGKWGKLTATDARAVRYQQALAIYKNVLQQWGQTGANLTENENEKMAAANGAINDNMDAIVSSLKGWTGTGTPEYARTIAQGAIDITSQVETGLMPFVRSETQAVKDALDARGASAGGSVLFPEIKAIFDAAANADTPRRHRGRAAAREDQQRRHREACTHPRCVQAHHPRDGPGHVRQAQPRVRPGPGRDAQGWRLCQPTHPRGKQEVQRRAYGRVQGPARQPTGRAVGLPQGPSQDHSEPVPPVPAVVL